MVRHLHALPVTLTCSEWFKPVRVPTGADKALRTAGIVDDSTEVHLETDKSDLSDAFGCLSRRERPSSRPVYRIAMGVPGEPEAPSSGKGTNT